MSIEDQHAELPDVGAATESARSLSLLRRAEQERAKRENSLFLDVPSWNGDLIGEYRIIDKDILEDMAKRNQAMIRIGRFEKVKGDIELILKAAVALWVRDPESGDRVVLEDDLGPVGYDRIHLVLGVDHLVSSASDSVRYLMAERSTTDDSWVENIVAIGLHAQSISRWMKDPSKKTVDLEELLGES